eukprot:31772-Pleurochrysis_carterae.AAC.8
MYGTVPTKVPQAANELLSSATQLRRWMSTRNEGRKRGVGTEGERLFLVSVHAEVRRRMWVRAQPPTTLSRLVWSQQLHHSTLPSQLHHDCLPLARVRRVNRARLCQRGASALAAGGEQHVLRLEVAVDQVALAQIAERAQRGADDVGKHRLGQLRRRRVTT